MIAWPPVIFVVCAAAGCLLHFALPIRVMSPSASHWLGVALSLSSGALALWAERVMKAAGTNVRPDRPALSIVKSGPYRLTRNPMYVSLCLLQLALGFLLNGWIPLLFAVVLAMVLHFGVVLREESYLEQKFGEQYLAFKRRVRRWL